MQDHFVTAEKLLTTLFLRTTAHSA